jgi:cytochrome c oxidase assembly protein subunit 15
VTNGGTDPVLRRLATATAAATLALVLAGGFVTTTRTGDTIPTWPKTWGTMKVGWPVEAAHRWIAAAVAVLAVAVAARARGAAPAVRKLAWIAVAGVVVQALIGGLRIFTDAPTLEAWKRPVAIVHACFGQAVFCAVVAIALLVSETWARAQSDERAWAARKLGVVTTVFAFLQLVAGAVTRHTGAGLVVHLVGAGLVLLHVSLLSSRLMLTSLRGWARGLSLLLALQVLLGVATWAITSSGFVRSHEAPMHQLLTVSGHVAVGAALLAACVCTTLLCRRGGVPAAAAAPALEAARA